MATQHQVRQYLAYWFQLGKRVFIHNGSEALLPQPVIRGEQYSSEFEACWRQVISPDSGDCYLEGTDQTVRELLTPNWEVNPCARCNMPVPVVSQGLPSVSCPCSDLPLWPNLDVPTPRSPVNSQAKLTQIQERLLQSGQRTNSAEQTPQAS